MPPQQYGLPTCALANATAVAAPGAGDGGGFISGLGDVVVVAAPVVVVAEPPGPPEPPEVVAGAGPVAPEPLEPPEPPDGAGVVVTELPAATSCDDPSARRRAASDSP